MLNSDLEIRKLPPADILHLSRILELGEGWKHLMAIIPNENSTTNIPKYTVEHMQMVETAGEKQSRYCAEILLDEWSTSGRKRPNLSLLLDLLVKAELFRAADYVSMNLLNQEAPKRPRDGPAALVELPKTEEIFPAFPKPSTLFDGFTRTITSSIDESVDSLQLRETTPISSEPELDLGDLKVWSYKELRSGTVNFSESLGKGAFGEVFLWPGEGLAVKRLLSQEGASFIGESSFKRELRLISSVPPHPNLLPLLGYSLDGPFPCLIYTFMPKGSLMERLEEGDPQLNWERRVKVADGTAKGILHLHLMPERPLIHRDVKSANILLDALYIPKVGDFGLIRGGPVGDKTSFQTTTVVGTSAYMAPEAFRGDVSPKMDVFSLGVVILELITGLPPYDENRESSDLVSHVEEIDDILSISDRRINWGEGTEKLICEINKIAEHCLMEKKHRPTMTIISQYLTALTISEYKGL